jgi:hypothetical protein
MSEANKSDEKEKQANLGAACFRCRGFRFDFLFVSCLDG